LRTFFKLSPKQTGVLVIDVHPTSVAFNNIFKDDIIIAIDCHLIANDGSIPFRKKERITFDYMISKKSVGDICHLTIFRNGQKMEVNLRLDIVNGLVPLRSFPSYYIYCGIVFVKLTGEYLREFGDDWFNISPRRLLHLSLYSLPSFPNQDVIIISHVLPDEINNGYSAFTNMQVKSVNGISVLNLYHFVQLVESLQISSPFLRIDLEEKAIIVVDTFVANQRSPHILKKYQVPCNKSSDL